MYANCTTKKKEQHSPLLNVVSVTIFIDEMLRDFLRNNSVRNENRSNDATAVPVSVWLIGWLVSPSANFNAMANT
jgi:hypothetical protein